MDGRWGFSWSNSPFAYCAAGKVYIKRLDGVIEAGQHVPLRLTRTFFRSNGTMLAGLLIEPAEAQATRPLLIQVHGSNANGWINGRDEWSHEAYLVAAHGISTFVFDKHGTGESAGQFHMNFHRLAADVMAASDEVRRMAAGRFGRLGLFGSSQGGWVAPLAASKARADFMIIASGGVFSPIEEDSEEVFQELREKGYGEDVMAKARILLAATHAIRGSNYLTGFEQLADAKRRFGDEPWFRVIDGEFTGSYLRADEAELRARRGQNPMDIPWDHDAVAVLRTLSLPTLWIRSGRDRQSPPGLTEQRLARLQGEGKPIQVAVFPTADHAQMEFTEAADGRRSYTRFSEGYYPLIVDWVKGVLSPPYGNATLTPPR
jgi:pimeloyl-ACP methyl ester carboxylesterase